MHQYIRDLCDLSLVVEV